MIEKVFNKLVDNGLTISFCESITGGALMSSITRFSGASNVLKGGIVAYNKEIKINLLGVNEETINKYSTVSKEVSLEMVLGLKKHIKSDIYVSITGNAGPSFEPNSNKLECFITIDYKNTYTYHLNFSNNNRINNINKATIFTYEKLNEILDYSIF